MKTIGKYTAVWLLTVCLMLTTIPFAFAQTPSFEASLFEADNSYLTADQYAGLGFNLGSAAAFDRAQSVYPLASDSTYTLENVKYGWSNPQTIAVMLSSPYWNELDYGSDMNAAGSTSFSLSSGVETSASGEIDLALGLSVSASAKTEIFGNGVEIGGELKGTLNKALEAQVAKASGKTLTFQAGAGDDHVALVVFPMASYQYSYKNSSGEKEYLYVNMQFEPTRSVTTLDNYNRVVREHNAAQSDESQMLPVISMDYIAPGYITGDPSTGFATADDFPDCLLFENGKLMASSQNSALADDQLVGEVYVSDSSYSVSIGNADTGAESSREVSASNGTSHSLGLSLDASIYGEISAGGDIGVAEVSSSVRVTLSASMGASVSHAILNTSGVSYSVMYTDLPASAKTGTTTAGNPTSDYAFNAQLAVWTPTSCGSNISIAPSIIGSLVQFNDTDKMPLYLPDDLHVAGATDTTITLGWTNPDFGTYPFNKRKPSVYEIVTAATGNAGTTYVTIDTVSADEEQFTVTGLSPDTTYTYLLRASDENGRYSAYGPSIDAATSTADRPTIITQPQSSSFALGEQPLFTIEAIATDNSYALSYQWYKLENSKYGTSWTLVQNSSDNTFNAAYFDTNGTITSANRYNLDDTTYRCVVVEIRGNTAVSVTSDSATLTVADNYFIRTYNDLREIALSIQNGQTALSRYDYVLANDIAVPSGENWDVPIGSQSVPFSGSFDGQGHTISGLRSNTSDLSNVGLFGVLKNATVCNLHLTDVDFYASRAYVGGICGKAQNSTISGCTVSGTINGSSGMGGGYGLGGICGYAESGTVIDNCRSECTMEGQIGAIGGIVGYNYSTVTDCATSGSVKIHCPVDEDYTTMNAYGGGIVGYNGGSVQNCYSTISPSASSNYGGFTDELTNKNAAVNSYYVNSFDNGSGGKTADQFASGEVAFLLNSGVTDGTQSWYQNLDNGKTPDHYPVLSDNGDNTVYAVMTSDADAIRDYSNYPQSDNVSILTRQSARALHRYTGTGDHQVVHNFAIIDNNKKVVTLFITSDVESVGILKNQGLGGTAGEIALLGDHHVDTRSYRDILAVNEQERLIYTDGNGCIFIKIPADLSSLPALKVRYTNKLSENYTATDYTLNIRVVDEEMLQTLGASKLSQLAANDPDYDVLHGKVSATTTTSPSQESPKTGDHTHLFLLLSAIIVSGIGTVLCSKKVAHR